MNTQGAQARQQARALSGGADVAAYMQDLGARARRASKALSAAPGAAKNAALQAIAEAIEAGCTGLLEANARDLEAGRAGDLAAPLLDRLELTGSRVSAMAQGLREICALPDPVGAVTDLNYRPSGIQVGRMRVPLGVIGIIYESRPNVTVDAAGLCLKAGNATLLRGGSEAYHSNQALAGCIRQGLERAGLPQDCVQVVETTDRAAVGELIRMTDSIDVIIPRGGKSLIERISREARVPVIKHLDGICHVYIDDRADLDKAVAIAVNAKCRRYGICGAMETLLVAAGVAGQVLPELAGRYREAGVELRGCPRTRDIVEALPADEQDWRTEYLAPILSVRVVDDVDQAMAHIAEYGSHHTDAIVTEDLGRARRFLREVDSSSVMVNASTQFADGGEFGMGAEIGIATGRLHARGPVGAEQLTSFKYKVRGQGTIRV